MTESRQGGRESRAALRPRSHKRDGKPCGPFREAGIPHPGIYRQSLLRAFSACPRRTLHEMMLPGDLSVGNVGASADLGAAFHAVVAEMLRTMRREGEEQMPTQEAVEIMRETLAAGPWVLPARELDDLRWLVLNVASGYRLNPRRIMAVEERLEAEVLCPDGEIRTLTGTPDVLIADPPDGIGIDDHKSGMAKPKAPEDADPEDEEVVGKQYLSEGGFFQLQVYGLLVFRNYPRAQRVVLRERSWRWPKEPPRVAVLGRDELEHVEHGVGLWMMQVDRAIREGLDSELAKPRPGSHCVTACPVSRSCPIPAEQRGLGALDSPEAANAEAGRLVVVKALGKTMHESLKAFHEQTGLAPEVGDGTVMRWKQLPSGGRRFGPFPRGGAEYVEPPDLIDDLLGSAEEAEAAHA